MSIGFPSATSAPSGITALPSGAKRPAFGTLYGFDAEAISNFNVTTRNTEANILASAPTNPTDEANIAFGTDSYDFYIYDGSAWYIYNNDS
jgi:hypothetical protein